MSLLDSSPEQRNYVPAEQPDTTSSAFKLFDVYMTNRKHASELNGKLNNGELMVVQEDVRNWIDKSAIFDDQTEYYGNYDHGFVSYKFNTILDYLQSHHAEVIDPIELETSKQFVDSTFAMYGDGKNYDNSDRTTDGSYAFVVPVRMARKHKEYGQESETVIPVLRYVPNDLRAQMLVGLPPFIIDRFEPTENGKTGYVVWGGVSQDLMDDMSLREGLDTARQNVKNAVDFAQKRLGVNVAGLGATLPGLMNLGRHIVNPDVIITTGHGGTVRLIEDTITAASERGYTKGLVEKIGILGMGSIGSSIAELVSDRYKDARFSLFDQNSQKTIKVVESLRKKGIQAEVANNEAEVISASEVTIAAITSRLQLQELGLTNLAGKFFIDDSEPACLDPAQVNLLGGRMTKVVGEDTNGATAVRESYDYGTMLNPQRDLFGCEAEAASLSRYYDELSARVGQRIANRVVRKLAITGPVTPRGARLIGVLFQRYGIEPAIFQAFKEPTPSPIPQL